MSILVTVGGGAVLRGISVFKKIDGLVTVQLQSSSKIVLDAGRGIVMLSYKNRSLLLRILACSLQSSVQCRKAFSIYISWKKVGASKRHSSTH